MSDIRNLSAPVLMWDGGILFSRPPPPDRERSRGYVCGRGGDGQRQAAGAGRPFFHGEDGAAAVDGSLQLPTEFAVEGVRTTAPQGDGEQNQTPEQRIFPSAPAPGEPLRPVRNERDHCELDRG